MQSTVKHIGQRLFDDVDDLLAAISGAEMSNDDLLIFEEMSTLDIVVQVHVTMLVNFLFAVPGGDECHFRD